MQRLPVFWSSCSFPASSNSVRDLKAIQEEIVVLLLDHCLSSRAPWASWKLRLQEVGLCGFLAGPDDFSELAHVAGFSCGVHGGDDCEDDSVDDDDDDAACKGFGVNDKHNVWLDCGNDGDDGGYDDGHDKGDDDGDNEDFLVYHGGDDDGADNVGDDDYDGNDDGDDGGHDDGHDRGDDDGDDEVCFVCHGGDDYGADNVCDDDDNGNDDGDDEKSFGEALSLDLRHWAYVYYL